MIVEKVTVSVIMITYGHEAFISQAIEGVLLQKCNFKIELIIANDCSKDNTDLVVKRIIAEQPNVNWIKYTCHTENKGMMANFIWALQQAQGKYVAICEGDDYWTDPCKLQKQFDFLESNPNYLLCAHRIGEQNGSKFYSIENNKIEYTFSDFSISGSCNGIYTCSMIFRNIPNILDIWMLDWVLRLDGGDHLILLLSTMNGHKVKLLNDQMGVYRIHDGGVWSSSTIEKKVKDAIISSKLYNSNLSLSKIQKNQVIYGLSPRIHQFYCARIKNKYFRKGISILIKIIFISGPGYISTRFVRFFSNRILSKA
jgi:glycosyltransferase involved in cell wall biosynthesis